VLRDLSERPWTDPQRPVAFMGDNEREWDYGTRAFRVELSRGLLEEIDRIVGQLERRPALPATHLGTRKGAKRPG
jgi:hypothetical protein